jgi:hypothetical protein
MPNSNTPFGLAPVEYLSGAKWNGQARRYCIPSTDGNAYAIGDVVTIAGSADAKGIPTVVLATPGSGVLGVIVGMGGLQYGGPSADPTNLNTTVIPATKTKAYYVLVADDPNIIFEVQEIGTGTPLAATEVGLNANLVAGTNNGYVSGWLLTNTTEAVTATLDVKLLGLSQRIPDNAFGAYAKWNVLINNHYYRVGSLGL